MKDIVYWANIFANFSAWSILLPLAVGFWRYNSLNRIVKVVLAFVIASGIFESIVSYMSDQGIKNIQLIPYWVVIETLFLTIIFHSILQGFWKKVVLMALALILLMSLASMGLWSNTDTFSSNLHLVQAGIFMVLCLVYFYQLFDRGEVRVLGRDPVFWFVTAFFIYFCGNLFFFIASNTSQKDFTQQELDFYLGIWMIFLSVMILRNILLTIGFWRIPGKWTSRPS